ncbi:MAG TPA: site-specific integrase, partial [Streptosporangiaceae bacterium]|nr:site-specific integrase [Streptosporangiaceae bacterium]
DRKKIKSQNTIDNLTWAIDKQIIPAIGRRRLRDLDCENVEDMLADMAATGMSTSSLIRIHTTLTRALKWAQSRGKILRNVSDLVETPLGTQRPSIEFTVAQVGRILLTAKGSRLEALWILGFVLGMRPGELTGLRWDNVDLDTGVISILESLKSHAGKLSQGSTKTKQSRRKLKALPIAITALKAHQERQQADRLAAGAWWTDTGYVFTSEVGTPINPANLRRAFRALVKAADIPAKQPTEDIPDPGQWHPNEMRHSAGSYMDHMGIPRERIADILGHKGTRTTEEVYIHPQEVIDMTSPAFEAYGNQFGNQPAEGETER